MEIPNTAESKLRTVLADVERSLGKVTTSLHDRTRVQDRGSSDGSENRKLALDLLGGEKPLSANERPSDTAGSVQATKLVQGSPITPTDRESLYRMADQRIAKGITEEQLEGALRSTVEATELNGAGVDNPMTPRMVRELDRIQDRMAQYGDDMGTLVSMVSLLVKENAELRTKVNALLVDYLKNGLNRFTLKR